MFGKILICEDEKNIVSFLKAELLHEGIDVDVAYDGINGLQLFKKNEYDVILLDLMLPGKNGAEVLREIRKTSQVPVIIITARKEVYDKISLFDCGADDYVTKPFDTMELLARIRRSLKRNEKPKCISVKNLSADYENYIAKINESDLGLTKTEFEILFYLLENKNKVLTREQIINKVFGSFYGDSNIVDVNIKNIRAKISAFTGETIITTVRGKGYVIRK